MNRRTFIISALASGAIGVAGTTYWLSVPQHQDDMSIAALQQFLLTLDTSQLTSNNSWPIAKTFHHLAQSVDYSITGFPQHKPQWFKSLFGATAFSVFAAKRTMTHNLEEAIPGAPSAPSDLTVEQSLANLRESLSQFEAYQGPLADHFAYGPLEKNEYALAHVLHVRNHFEQITV